MSYTRNEESFLTTRGTTYSLWKGKSIAKRLGLIGTITCIFDTIINLASSRSKVVNDFFDSTVPYYVSAIYYILPSASLLLYYFKTCCSYHCSDEQIDIQQDADPRVNELLNAFSEVDSFKEYINKYPNAIEEMQNKIKTLQDTNCIDKMDILINIAYFTLRALHGLVIIIKANDLASKETNDEITDWTDFIANVINLAYMMTMLVHNNFIKNKTISNPYQFFTTSIQQDDIVTIIDNDTLFISQQDDKNDRDEFTNVVKY